MTKVLGYLCYVGAGLKREGPQHASIEKEDGKAKPALLCGTDSGELNWTLNFTPYKGIRVCSKCERKLKELETNGR